MLQSAQRRKQRLFRFTAPMHVRQKFVHAHVAKELAQKLGIKKRSAQIHKGDTVKIMAGANRGKSGTVNSVNMKRGMVLVDGIARKNAKGKESLMPIRVSNLYITDMKTDDRMRKLALGIKQ